MTFLWCLGWVCAATKRKKPQSTKTLYWAFWKPFKKPAYNFGMYVRFLRMQWCSFCDDHLQFAHCLKINKNVVPKQGQNCSFTECDKSVESDSGTLLLYTLYILMARKFKYLRSRSSQRCERRLFERFSHTLISSKRKHQVIQNSCS